MASPFTITTADQERKEEGVPNHYEARNQYFCHSLKELGSLLSQTKTLALLSPRRNIFIHELEYIDQIFC